MIPLSSHSTPSCFTFAGKGDERALLRQQLTHKKQSFAAWVREHLDSELHGAKRANVAQAARIAEIVRSLSYTSRVLAGLLGVARRTRDPIVFKNASSLTVLFKGLQADVDGAICTISNEHRKSTRPSSGKQQC